MITQIKNIAILVIILVPLFIMFLTLFSCVKHEVNKKGKRRKIKMEEESQSGNLKVIK
ncbi:hypothetical protein RH915_06960 [Serpentinicella sp. ANB-PHB4]|uniref:hypothetical protein n=1 Tax=Serpentinicella sp. ANB-PHB4 TaxID=3074076 RepID=UPI00285DD519|nr:hypothetical protein [Serpentinicella sp. ANB-PHB4]MDR5659226.1 hypothetical protein [Serpentinicella sp. ANB-PHB4]